MDGKRQAICFPDLILRTCWAGGDFTVRASEGWTAVWVGATRAGAPNPASKTQGTWAPLFPNGAGYTLKAQPSAFASCSASPLPPKALAQSAGCSRTHRDPLTCLCKKSAWKRGTRGSFSPCTIKVGHSTRGSRSRQMLPARHETALLRPGADPHPRRHLAWIRRPECFQLRQSPGFPLLAFFL